MAIMKKMKQRFQGFKRKKSEEIREQTEEQLLVDTQVLQEEGKEFVKKRIQKKELTVEDYCEQVIDCTRNLQQKKIEYEQVTAYLTDIQLLDQMTGEERERVQAVAYKLNEVAKDRKDMQDESRALTQLQFRFMQLHEHEIPEGIKQMQEQEAYQKDIRSDLQKLEEERVNLKYEEKYYLEKLHNLKMIILSVLFLAVIVAAGIGFFYTQYIFDIRLVFLCLLFFVAVAGTSCFVRYRNVNYALAYCRKQQMRAAKFINRVKLKWVNNTATLDYMYEKYNVGSSRELLYMWQLYQQTLENEEKYKHSSRELDHYGALLLKLLGHVGVHDADIWLTQPEALLDSREMVEVTHHLNGRRQKLREEMEIEEDMMDASVEAIRDVMQKNPETAMQVQRILEPYHIRL